jgi:hypothetical protein
MCRRFRLDWKLKGFDGAALLIPDSGLEFWTGPGSLAGMRLETEVRSSCADIRRFRFRSRFRFRFRAGGSSQTTTAARRQRLQGALKTLVAAQHACCASATRLLRLRNTLVAPPQHACCASSTRLLRLRNTLVAPPQHACCLRLLRLRNTLVACACMAQEACCLRLLRRNTCKPPERAAPAFHPSHRETQKVDSERRIEEETRKGDSESRLGKETRKGDSERRLEKYVSGEKPGRKRRHLEQ